MRMRICRKEARESVYWLRLIDVGTEPELSGWRGRLVNEGGELVRILSAILRKMDADRNES